jgi:hypothetical protein
MEATTAKLAWQTKLSTKLVLLEVRLQNMALQTTILLKQKILPFSYNLQRIFSTQ